MRDFLKENENEILSFVRMDRKNIYYRNEEGTEFYGVLDDKPILEAREELWSLCNECDSYEIKLNGKIISTS